MVVRPGWGFRDAQHLAPELGKVRLPHSQREDLSVQREALTHWHIVLAEEAKTQDGGEERPCL
ncbi:hypothetical protein SCP_0207330 [Sparassis crispa]|uniref:Uncharacterized protein n=1 Tax=Sparassis crispa TaxID=139825 RepID=A0A401GBM4_9APHY|nr:hypothetical protein SCP_0207330 [Sparassis crispa]GBE79533.1 hypothetical protein SCP_0207330 [Sparassis crispa]